MKKSVKILIFVSVIAILTALCAFAEEYDGFEYLEYNEEVIITDYVGTKTSITIPYYINNHSVTAIGPEALRNKNLTSVVLLDNIVSVGEGAFADNPDLHTLLLSKELKSIPDRMCENDSSLYHISIYGNVKSIGDAAFKNCSSFDTLNFFGTQEQWDSVVLGEDWNYGVSEFFKVEFVSPFTFTIFSASEAYVSGYEYYSSDVVIPMYYSTQNNARLYFVSSIGNNVFYRKGITSVVFPKTLTNIGKGAFEDNPGLKSVVLPNSLSEIKPDVFKDDTGLEEVYITTMVTMIYHGAFEGCTSLKDIYYGGTEAQWDAVTKENGWNKFVPADCVVHFESTGLPVSTVSEPEADAAVATNLRRHSALRFTATSEDYNDFDKLGFLISRKDTMKSYGFAELNHDTKVCGTPLYIEAICVDETHNRVYGENNTGVRTYSVIASIPSDKTDTVFVARPFLEIGACTVYGRAMEGSFDDLSV